MKCFALPVFAVLLARPAAPDVPPDSLEAAASAFERGDLASADAMLRGLVGTSPDNAHALGLLAAVLDSEKKYLEADQLYQRALKLTPRSATLLNNYANHQLAMGNREAARATYLKVIAADPTRANANLQLAAMAIERKNGIEALRYTQHLPAAARSEPQVQILQMQALFLAHHTAEANTLLQKLTGSSEPRLNFSAGLGLASVEQYGAAEQFFSRALEAAPDNFDVLYNLGLAAFHAGHLERARSTLSTALAQRPGDADVLFSLAAVSINLRQQQDALRLLSEASRIDPSRPNIQLALAQTASALGYYADSRLAYERYLKLQPGDQQAQRDHLFTVALSEQPRDGLLALKAFTAAHERDATAHYEVGVLEAKNDPADAALHFSKALSLQPGYPPARLGRGTLNYLQGRPAEALPDLEFAVAQYPDNAAVLDRLGEVLNALNRPAEAVSALTRASQISPRDSRILMHLSRAQAKAGDAEGTRATLARFRALGPQPGNLIPQAGVVDFLALPPEQQEARYREAVTMRLRDHPDDVDLNKRAVEILMKDGAIGELAPAVERLLATKPPGVVAAEVGHTLLCGRQYAVSKLLLDYAAAQSPHDQALQLDLAIADLHTSGPVPGLERLDHLSTPARTGDFFLARAILLEAEGRRQEAHEALGQAEGRKPTNVNLYDEAVNLLVQNGRRDEAQQVVALAEASLPNNTLTQLLRAELGS